MTNRRRHYRHPFFPAGRLQVTLTAPNSTVCLEGEVMNLSIGGMCIESHELRTSAQERWIAQISLAPDAPPLRIPVERIYAQNDERTWCGFRFQPPTNLNVREEQEKQIWKFLLEEQRSERRRQQETRRNAG
jgi:c-di-GMP-binding flagellar brake protein YcgR